MYDLRKRWGDRELKRVLFSILGISLGRYRDTGVSHKENEADGVTVSGGPISYQYRP